MARGGGVKRSVVAEAAGDPLSRLPLRSGKLLLAIMFSYGERGQWLRMSLAHVPLVVPVGTITEELPSSLG